MEGVGLADIAFRSQVLALVLGDMISQPRLPAESQLVTLLHVLCGGELFPFVFPLLWPAIFSGNTCGGGTFLAGTWLYDGRITALCLFLLMQSANISCSFISVT